MTDCNTPDCRRDPDKEYNPDDAVNPNPNQCTLCTGDTSNNMFFVPRAPGYPWRCVLDEMTYDQVSYVLERIPGAKEDLIRITDDPILLKMARDSELIESPIDDNERVRKRLNSNSLPMYTVLRGNIDGSVR